LAIPESDAWRTVALVPRLSGAYFSSTLIVTTARPSGVMSIFSTEPAGVPPTCTRLPLTSCAAFWKWTLTV
jgi:hypothetical protein